ncbi:MAG: hypothetical protein ONB12_04060 [candidate division KSB1 bacterium]|nr:hypothetical protein [candidate division KSB1 bacterium]
MEKTLYSLHLIFGIGATLFYAAMVVLLMKKQEEEALKAPEKVAAHAARISLLGAFASGLLAAVAGRNPVGTLHYYTAVTPLLILITFRLVLTGKQPTYRAYRILFGLITVALFAGLVTGFLH